MNFTAEKNKPLFVVRAQQVNFTANARQMLNEALACNTAVHAESVPDDFFVKSAAAHKMQPQLLVKLGESTPAEIKDLVVKRLKTDASEKFEFMDGTVFTGAQAAQEVATESRIGRYFLELEKETLRIAQQAYGEGKI